MRQVAIYMLTDPTGSPTCYVGASCNPDKRYKEHLTSWGTRASVWIHDLRAIGMKPMLSVLDWVPEVEAKVAEMDAISMVQAIRGECCLNGQGGGYGVKPGPCTV